VGVGVGVGVGFGVGVGVGVGFGVLLGVGLVVGSGLVASGLGSVAVGVGVALGVALALALALGDALGAAEAPMTLALSASVVFTPAVAAGRLAHALVALSRLAPEAWATEEPPVPLGTKSSAAKTPPNVRRPNVIVAPPLCQPQGRRRSFVPYSATVRICRLTHSLQSPFDTSSATGCHSPRGKAVLRLGMGRAKLRRTRATFAGLFR
jgi:hypothetical protein